MANDSARANLVWVEPLNNAKDIATAVKDYVEDLKTEHFIEFAVNQTGYQMFDDDSKWEDGILTGTLYKLRHDRLPSAINGDGATQLPIDPDTDLGEPMCFAFWPKYFAAAVHYSHNGPRYPRMADILYGFGFDDALYVYPVFDTEMLKKMAKLKVIRSAEFALKTPSNEQALRAVSTTVSHALDIRKSTSANFLRVEVSMGHEAGTLSKVKNMLKGLSKFGDDVSSLKIKGRLDEDSETLEYNLINERIVEEFQTKLNGRYLDTAHCCQALRSILKSNKATLKDQTTSDSD